jgi:cell division protein FtsQ
MKDLEKRHILICRFLSLRVLVGGYKMTDRKVITIHDHIPKLKEQRRQKTNRKLIFFLSIFFMLIMLVVYYQSPLSHVNLITVEGNYYVDEQQIISISELSSETNIWKLNKSDLVDKIKSMEEIANVDLNRRFPNHIQITLQEYKRIAYLYSDGKYIPIIESGKFLEELPKEAYPYDAPILVNWEQGLIIEEFASELTKIPESIANRISEIFYTPIEQDAYRITIYMNDGNKVQSTVRNFAERIAPYSSIVSELDPTQKGIIHMRITPYFEAFEEDELSEGEG